MPTLRNSPRVASSAGTPHRPINPKTSARPAQRLLTCNLKHAKKPAAGQDSSERQPSHRSLGEKAQSETTIEQPPPTARLGRGRPGHLPPGPSGQGDEEDHGHVRHRRPTDHQDLQARHEHDGSVKACLGVPARRPQSSNVRAVAVPKARKAPGQRTHSLRIPESWRADTSK